MKGGELPSMNVDSQFVRGYDGYTQAGRVTADRENHPIRRKVRTPQSVAPGKSRMEVISWIGPQKQTAPSSSQEVRG
jgi:hypothetical protein